MCIREVYQTLRDRFQGKCRLMSVFDVKLNDDNSVCLTSTISGGLISYIDLYEMYEENINDVIGMFIEIEHTYQNKGFSTLLGKPTFEFMQSLDTLFAKANYHTYSKNTVITTQLTIYKED